MIGEGIFCTKKKSTLLVGLEYGRPRFSYFSPRTEGTFTFMFPLVYPHVYIV